MTAEKVAWGTVLLLLFSNAIGFLYSYVVLKTSVLKKYRIQNQEYKEGVFNNRMPLFIFNFVTLLVFSGVGAYFIFDYLDTTLAPWYVIAGQVIFAFLIDDLFFYFYHRYLHENKFLLKHIHSIHHRATKPFPLEYLYAHPLEWMTGTLGVVLGFVGFTGYFVVFILTVICISSVIVCFLVFRVDFDRFGVICNGFVVLAGIKTRCSCLCHAAVSRRGSLGRNLLRPSW